MAKQTFTTGQVLTAQQVNDLQTNDFNQTVSAKTASYTLVAADKGTRITMSSTSATTITVNTGLFAGGDTLFIQNLNTGVCTITAGTATVSTSATLALAEHEGGTLYFTSAGVSTFFKAAGAAAAGGGWTLLSTTNISGTSTSLGSFSGYKNLWLVIANWTSTSNESRGILANGVSNICTGSFVERGAASRWEDASLQLNTSDNIKNTGDAAWNVFIYNYADTARYKNFAVSGYWINTASQKVAHISGGVIATNSAITTLDVNGGTAATAGTILLYGGN